MWPGFSKMSSAKRPQDSPSLPASRNVGARKWAASSGERNSSVQNVASEFSWATTFASGKRFQAAMWSLK